MSSNAWAVAITEENIRGVIQSEAGLNFNLEDALEWLEEHKEGWFVRDEETVLDCQFFEPNIFPMFYKFVSVDNHSLFRRVEQVY